MMSSFIDCNGVVFLNTHWISVYTVCTVYSAYTDVNDHCASLIKWACDLMLKECVPAINTLD